MTAYVIANLVVADPAFFSEFGEQVLPIIKQFGGRCLGRVGCVENLEGGARTQTFSDFKISG